MNKKLLLIEIIAFIAIFVLFVLLSGCAEEGSSRTPEIGQECVNLCKAELEKGTDLSKGPCLSNALAEDTEWVCDVAHEPRELVDNDAENQCSAYREGTAKHFVEVSPTCELIRVV
jgi:hypothetical protein